tara:strand:+ start:10012 stop:10428 length:417 start_codon:yes stop_codon:yes gene_type:complete
MDKTKHSVRNSMGVGYYGELAVRKELHKQGYNVYLPQCDNDGVDLVVEHKNHDKFIRVNVKTFTKLKTNTSIELRMTKHVGTGRVQCVAVYYEPKDIIAFIPYNDKSDCLSIALGNAKNNQQKTRTWFWAYSNFPEFE